MNVPQKILTEMDDAYAQAPRPRRRSVLVLFVLPLVLIVLCAAAMGAVFSEEIWQWANDVYYAFFPPPPMLDNCPGCGMG